MRNSRKLLVTALLLFGASVSTVSEESPARPERGVISGNVYTNDYFGLSYEFPEGWRAQAKAAARGAEPRTHFFFLLTASPGSRSRATPANPGIVVMASEMALHPGIQTGKDYLLRMNRRLINPQFGSELLEGPVRVRLGGKEFWRSIHKRPEGDKAVRQAVLAAIVKNHLLLFIFGAETKAALKEILETTRSISFRN